MGRRPKSIAAENGEGTPLINPQSRVLEEETRWTARFPDIGALIRSSTPYFGPRAAISAPQLL